MRNQLIDVRPVAGGIGAEIFGPDLSEDLSEEMVAAGRSALLEHCVIFFRDQKISDVDLARFGRQFGELAPLPPHRQFPGKFPELLVVDKKPEDKLNFGWEWHSDTSHLEVPSLGSILVAKIVPPSMWSLGTYKELLFLDSHQAATVDGGAGKSATVGA